MRIIGAEHHQLRKLAHDRPERFEVTRSTSLAHQNVHPTLRLLARLFKRETLVIRGNPRCDVPFCLVTTKSRRVSVHWFSSALRRGDLRHNLAVAAEYAGPIHHLREITQSIVGK